MKTPRLFGNGKAAGDEPDDESMGNSGKQGEIGPGTRMQLGWVITLGVCLVGTTAAYFSTLGAIKAELNTINSRLDMIYNDYWSRNQQEIFALRLRLMNSNLIVPEVENVAPKKRAQASIPDAAYGKAIN